MSTVDSILYSPALRMKAGELAGVRDLAADVARAILPRFIIPPVADRDPKQPVLFMVDRTPDVSVALGRHWRGKKAFIDVTHLVDEIGRPELSEWLPAMLRRARQSEVDAIPLASLSDLASKEGPAFATSMGAGKLKLGVLVSVGEMIGPEFSVTLKGALAHAGVEPSDCAVVADFSNEDFSAPSVVAPIIGAMLEQLQEVGEWQHIIFQGTHYPESNRVADGARELWPRNEWAAWKEAVRFDPSTADYMMFGDYAADSAKMDFRKGRAAAIRHYRYTTSSAWLIQRGEKIGSDMQIMRNVCQQIVASEHFAGPGFSAADAYIYRTAQGGDGPGNSTTWRQVNTTHHITRVVADIGRVRGVAIAEVAQRPNLQMTLL
jgi:hypothetical protein